MGKAKINIPMCAALVLLLLTMISIHLTCGLYARYTAISSSQDSARVAKFHVIGSVGEKDIRVNCTQTEKSGVYNITVSNQSEVTVKYIIYVKLDQNVVGTDLWVKMDGIEGSNVGQTMQFTRGPLPPFSDKTHTLELGVYNWATVTSKAEKPGDASVDWVLNFDVDIAVEQVD